MVIRKYGIQILGGLDFHPDYPFLNLFYLNPDQVKEKLSKELLCFPWYLHELHRITIYFHTNSMLHGFLK